MKAHLTGRLRFLAYAYAAEFVVALLLTGVFFASRSVGVLAWDIVPGLQVFVAALGAWFNFRLTGKRIWAAASIFLVYMAFSETFEFHRIIGRVLLHWEGGPVDLISGWFPSLMLHRHPQTISIAATSALWLVLVIGLFKHVRKSSMGFLTFCLSLVIMIGVIGMYLLVCRYGRFGSIRFGPAWGMRQVVELFGTFSLAMSFAFVAKDNKNRMQRPKPTAPGPMSEPESFVASSLDETVHPESAPGPPGTSSQSPNGR
ncbi:MAG: hypothetical protein HQ592_17740 [Planctomycetes bacterium]|nr:hypothetical protein [Planctomycetota bacterium]